jgi:hypothetical protein
MRMMISAAILMLAITLIGSATIIDLGDYIISTGSYNVALGPYAASRNETTGLYGAMAIVGKSTIALSEITGKFDKSNFTKAEGFEPVTIPYAGFLKSNNSDRTVSYIGMVNDGLLIAIVCDNYQEAKVLLKNVQVISKKDYNENQAAELIKSLK